MEIIESKIEIKKQNSIWYSILLSATSYNLAFLLPDFFAWAIVLFLPLLIPVFFRPQPFFHGFFWGMITFAGNLVWFFVLLHTHSQAGIIGAFWGYILVVGYFSLSSGLWFFVTYKILTNYRSLVMRSMTIITTAIVYFFVIDRWILTPVGRIEGYPFLNPLIPLAQYQWFLKVCAVICSFFFNSFNSGVVSKNNNLTDPKVLYLEPLINKKKGHDKPWRSSPYGVGQEIFHQLSQLNVRQYENRPVIIVAPESAYRFALNIYPDIIDLWGSVLPRNAHLLIGSHKRDGDKLYQAVYWINSGRIINFYVKKHLLPFVEKTPNMWRSFTWVSDLFLKNSIEFARGKNKREHKVFRLTPNLCALPTMCSEFFFMRSIGEFLILKKNSSIKKSGAIFFFVNDSWFCNYFCKQLELFTRLKSAIIGLPVLYITHSKVDCFNS